MKDDLMIIIKILIMIITNIIILIITNKQNKYE